MDEIEKAINDDKEKSEAVKTEDKKPTDEEVRVEQAKKDLADLEAAKVAALAELQKVRSEKRQVKKAPVEEPKAEVEKVIDLNDPDAKAWDKHITDKVSPALEELEREKAEIRQFALDEFLASRPALSKSPDKLKELMTVYDRLHTASERTKEGVLLDLDKAYAAVYHKELLEAAQQRKVTEARNDALFSDIAVSRGSTAYSAPKENPVRLNNEEQAILAKWGMSPQEWQKMKTEQDKKSAEAV